MTSIKTIKTHVPGLEARIYPDHDAEYDHDTLGTIAYLSRSRTVLGTQSCSENEMDAISRGVREGSIIGMPVWAYVHSGATVKAAWSNPFACPWDSGRSGWVYVSKEGALREHGRKRMDAKLKARIHAQLQAEVAEFDAYLSGDVYGYEIMCGDEVLDSCWGYVGMDGLEEELKALLEEHAGRIAPMTQQALPFEVIS